MSHERVLVVDDEETIRHVLQSVLEERGCEVRTAGSAEESLDLLDGWVPSVALLDVVLPGMNGIQLLEHIRQRSRDTEVLMMTSHSSAETAVKALQCGAHDYLEKPFDDLDEVWTAVSRAIEKRTLAVKNRDLQREQERRSREISSALSLHERSSSDGEPDAAVELVEFFLGLVTRELDVERASLMLLDERSGELRIVASEGVYEIDPRTVRVPLGRGVAGAVARSGRPILVEDIRTDPRFDRTNYPHLGGSFISAPVKADQRLLGVINVTNRRGGKPLRPEDVDHLTSLGNQLGAAVEEVAHADQLRRAYESLKETQKQLVFSERIKAIGQMAAGVAHDFNNALSVILGRAQFAQMRLKRGDPDLGKVLKDLDTIVRTALQGSETIKRIQDYTRIRRDAPKAPVDLNAAVAEAVEMSRPKWQKEQGARGGRIDVRLERGEIPEVTGNFYELTQVVSNLVFNAVEAMPEGGRLTFRTSVEGDDVVLDVEDTGAGMDEETRRRLFEPFFTTKDTGQGLGTSVIYGIVSRHRGEIEVSSTPGEGTSFRIRLPRHREEAADEGPANRAQDPTDGPGRVLLVDDDEKVLETFRETLLSNGHEVLAVSRASEALAILDGERFDLVISDFTTKGMDGLEFARRVRERDGGVPVLMLSGWAVQHREEEIRRAGVVQVVTKPCLIEDLVGAVRTHMRSPARRNEATPFTD